MNTIEWWGTRYAINCPHPLSPTSRKSQVWRQVIAGATDGEGRCVIQSGVCLSHRYLVGKINKISHPKKNVHLGTSYHAFQKE